MLCVLTLYSYVLCVSRKKNIRQYVEINKISRSVSDIIYIH